MNKTWMNFTRKINAYIHLCMYMGVCICIFFDPVLISFPFSEGQVSEVRVSALSHGPQYH